jgi:predicted transcriptional regulator
MAKTAISVPDSVHAAVDDLARRLRISRSEVYARAATEFLARQRRGRSTISAAVRRALSRGKGSSRVPRALERAQFEVLEREDW